MAALLLMQWGGFVLLALLASPQSNFSAQAQANKELAEAASLVRLHRFSEAQSIIQEMKVPDDVKQGIAFHRLRASIDAGLNKPGKCSDEMHAALKLSPDDAGLLKATAVADLVLLDARLHVNSKAGISAALAKLRSLNLPENDRAGLRCEVGERLLGARRFGEAVVDFSEAVRLVPSNGQCWAELADAQLKTGNPEAALASAQRAKALHDGAEIEALLGDIYERNGDSLSAVRAFEQAVHLSPNEERFRLALAIELLQHQTFEPALKVLEASAKDFPQSARIATALGLTLYLAGKEKEGTIKLLDAISLDPEFAPAIRYLGEISLLQSGSPETRIVKAECAYADAHVSEDQSNVFCAALQARVAAADPASADWAPIMRRLSLVAARSPDYALAHCEFGKALDQAQDARARVELEACVHLDPDSIEGHYRLARIYNKLGWSEKARQELALRAAAEQRIAASNEARENSVKRFLVSMAEQ